MLKSKKQFYAGVLLFCMTFFFMTFDFTSNRPVTKMIIKPRLLNSTNQSSVVADKPVYKVSEVKLAEKPYHFQRRFKTPFDCKKIVDDNSTSEIKKADVFTRFYRDYRDKKTDQVPFMVSKEYLEDLKMIPDQNFIFNESVCPEFINYERLFQLHGHRRRKSVSHRLQHFDL